MTNYPPASENTVSITHTIENFYHLLEEDDLDRWFHLWAEDGVYLNPFADEPFPRERLSGRERIVETVSAMWRNIRGLEILGRKDEPALVPERRGIVIYVSGDWKFVMADTLQSRTCHFHHRLEILNGRIASWVDYTNPLTSARKVLSKKPAPPAGDGGHDHSSYPEDNFDEREISLQEPSEDWHLAVRTH
jgi:ketosteroid isomerase-like protein